MKEGFLEFDRRAYEIKIGVITPAVPIFPEANICINNNTKPVSKNDSYEHRISHSEGRSLLPIFEQKRYDARVQRRSDVENEVDRRRSKK